MKRLLGKLQTKSSSSSKGSSKSQPTSFDEKPPPYASRAKNLPQVPPQESDPSLLGASISGLKLVFDIARESADAFPPLKSLLGGLSAIIKNYNVRT
jgi:hypothetical protein